MSTTYKQYEPDVLKRLQAAELEILSDFIGICERYNLDYFMYAGSGIGVIRHSGFIPWDDDVDVVMPRKDYTKFLEIIDIEMGHKYKVLTPLIDKKYSSNVTHLQMNNTTFIPYSSKNLKCDLGICIDLFPLDNVPNDEKNKKSQIRKAWILSKLIYLRGSGTPIIPLLGLKKIIAQIICYAAHILLTLFRVSPRWLFKKFEKVSQKYNDQETNVLNTFVDPTPSITYILKDEMYPLQYMDFEGLKVKMPHNYHDQLTRIFGDYMIIPPLEKRVNHCPYKIKFKDE